MLCFWLKVLFSDMEASSSVISIDLPRIEEKEGLPVEAFAKVKEIFSHVDWLDSKTEVANVLQQITASNIILEKLDSGVSPSAGSLLRESLSGSFKFDSKTQHETESLTSAVPADLPTSSLESHGNAPMEKKIEPLESKVLPEDNTKTLACLGHGDQPVPSFGLSKDSDSTKNETESSESQQSLENDAKFPTTMVWEEQSIPSIEPSIDANSMKKKIGSSLESEEKDIESLASKAMLGNDTMLPASVAQGKQSILLTEASTNANSRQKIGPLGSKEKEIESLDSKALLENDSRSKFEPKTPAEVDIRKPTSAVQGKHSMSSFESSVGATMEKKKEPLDLKASPENNIRTLAPTGQREQHIPSFGLSTDSDSTKVQNESLESVASVENETKFPTSMAQGKQSIPSIEPSMHANSMKRQLESKEKDIKSLESKSLLENDTKYPPSMAQGKQSIPSIKTSKDANSMKKKIGQSEPMVLSENYIKSPMSTVQKKQDSPLLEPSIDANSIKKKVDPRELQVALQLPTQSKIISPRMRQPIRSAPASYSNSLQGSPVAISRYHSAPSTLGITSVLQDHTPMDTKEEVSHAVTISPASTLPPSGSKVPKSIEPISTSVPPASSPALLTSLPLKSSVDPPSATKTPEPHAPTPPPPPPQREPTSELMQSTVSQHCENTTHDKNQKSLVTPPAPPPPPPPLPALSSPSLSHPPPSSLPETSLSTGKDSFKGPSPPPPPPAPPSSTGQQASSSSIPPPPPSSASHPLSSPSSTNNSAATAGPPPPPPPPPPRPSGTTSSSTPTPSVPPPPPPPASAAQNSLPKNSGNVPPVPPPPCPSANGGLSKPGTASHQPHAGAGNGNVPPVPPPSGAPFGAKGRGGLLRANPKSQTKRSNLKPYHWLKLTRAMQGSLWAETQKLDEASRYELCVKPFLT